MRILDLCAGTSSATQAFRDRGHDVDTLDIIGGHTFNMDVRKFKPWKKYDFIWASPPCTEFSIAKGISCKDRNPDMSIVEACFKICQTAPFWIVENPRGCLRYFIGKPTITVKYSDYGYCWQKPTDLWMSDGFPFFYSRSKHIQTKNTKYAIKGSGAFDLVRKDARALIPYGLSMAICKVLENTIS